MAHRSLVKMVLAAGLAGGAAMALGGCVVAAVGAGAGAGYALTQERSLSDTAKDAGIAAQVQQSWKKYNVQLYEDLGCTVYEGEVLITGIVPNDDWRAEAVKRSWAIEGVKQVDDEIQLGPGSGFTQDVTDDSVTGKLRTQLIADADVKSINYSITTVKGVVYLMGSARSEGERQRVIDYARNLANVRDVKSFIHIRTGAPVRAEAATAPPQAAPPAAAAGDERHDVGAAVAVADRSHAAQIAARGGQGMGLAVAIQMDPMESINIDAEFDLRAGARGAGARTHASTTICRARSRSPTGCSMPRRAASRCGASAGATSRSGRSRRSSWRRWT